MSQTEAASGLLETLSNELAAAVERAERAVVAVDGRPRLPGSGVVWPGGGIVTAAHVLERETDLQITTHDGRSLAARLVGRDPGSDLALLAVDGPLPEPAELAPPGSLKVGHLVLALGRPGRESPMATFGAVSVVGSTWRTARGGVLEGYIRTDLARLPGFSGGPIVDGQGRVAGVMSAWVAGGDSLALPAAVVDRIVQQSLRGGGAPRRGYLGISSLAIELQPALRQRLGVAQDTALMVVGLEPNGPAERGGLLLGDILVQLNGRPIPDGEALQLAVGPEVVGQAIGVRILRGGELYNTTLTPVQRP